VLVVLHGYYALTTVSRLFVESDRNRARRERREEEDKRQRQQARPDGWTICC